MLRPLLAFAVCLVGYPATTLSQTPAALPLMPLPQHATAGQGALPIGAVFKIVIQEPTGDDMVSSAAARLEHSLEQVSGHPVPLVLNAQAVSGQLTIVVHKAASAAVGADESYVLNITAEGARLEAPTSLGAVRGMATLRQLVTGVDKQALFPAVNIADAPLYRWRGVMIDCARHFVPMNVLERSLDAMELVKLNVLHLHLSDNEGFRVESKIFPDLQNMGSNGEFYTQAELKEFIHDASLRGIVVVPEFDMPSHAQSWLAGYPELSSSPGPFKAGQLNWGDVPSNPTTAQLMTLMATARIPALDPTQESTYDFIDRFIGEMSALFPSPYFHVGADENNGAVWLANPSIVAFMKAHQIPDAPALQAYFVSRVNALVQKHGRTMVAWEEAYAAGSKIGGVYEVWSPLAKVDLTKTQLPANDQLLISRGFYIDLFLPAYVHALNKDLPDSEAAAAPLLGGEAAMWTELADRTNLEARMWPRTGAIAERLWTPGTPGDADLFYQRLFRLSGVLDREGLHNLADYREGVARIAGTDSKQPVQTLLDVLTPLKGYKRLMSKGLPTAKTATAPLPMDQVADVVLVDSAAKYHFRAVVAAFLAQPNQASAQPVRTWLALWSANDARLKTSIAHSDSLAKVAGHSQHLAALATFTLNVIDRLQQAQPLDADQLAQADTLLNESRAPEGQTELSVVPELTALLHGTLAPEPTSYPLF